jgi:hypothetical protein
MRCEHPMTSICKNAKDAYKSAQSVPRYARLYKHIKCNSNTRSWHLRLLEEQRKAYMWTFYQCNTMDTNIARKGTCIQKTSRATYQEASSSAPVHKFSAIHLTSSLKQRQLFRLITDYRGRETFLISGGVAWTWSMLCQVIFAPGLVWPQAQRN